MLLLTSIANYTWLHHSIACDHKYKYTRLCPSTVPKPLFCSYAMSPCMVAKRLGLGIHQEVQEFALHFKILSYKSISTKPALSQNLHFSVLARDRNKGFKKHCQKRIAASFLESKFEVWNEFLQLFVLLCYYVTSMKTPVFLKSRVSRASIYFFLSSWERIRRFLLETRCLVQWLTWESGGE